LLDGKPVNAGSMLAAQAEGHNIATIEALGEHPEQGWRKTDGLHPLQRPLSNRARSNAATAPPRKSLRQSLLDKNPTQARGGPRGDLAGVLCRCTGYLKPVQAVMKAAAEMRGDTEPIDIRSASGDPFRPSGPDLPP
jgi:putative selenate reductase molybdopterin-binding subunit